MENKDRLASHLLLIGADYDRAVRDVNSALIADLYELLYKKDLISKTEITELLKNRQSKFKIRKNKKEKGIKNVEKYNQKYFDNIDQLFELLKKRFENF